MRHCTFDGIFGTVDASVMIIFCKRVSGKKNAKASTRSASLQSKLNSLLTFARKEAEAMEKEGQAYMWASIGLVSSDEAQRVAVNRPRTRLKNSELKRRLWMNF